MQPNKAPTLIKLLSTILLFFPALAFADSSTAPAQFNMTGSFIGLVSLGIFFLAYIVVMTEEFIHLRKSKPVIIASAIIWGLIAWAAGQNGLSAEAEAAVKHNLQEYVELFLFLLVAMTYVNAMQERNIFEALRIWLVKRGYGYGSLFWITGILAFFISPLVDNLTTALIMCAVLVAVGKDNAKFVSLGCINIVVAANAGGAYSPFGDITTLMVWQKGVLSFHEFFAIFIPALVNWFVPAALMYFAIPKGMPAVIHEKAFLKPGARRVMGLFFLTVVTAVCFHSFLNLPPVLGMMAGLGYLQFLGYYLKRNHHHLLATNESIAGEGPFDVFKKIQNAEWDTLLFFYGVMLCVGGLATLGYLDLVSQVIYNDWGRNLSAINAATPANVVIGLLSAVVDNIPVMYAVLTMHPDMSHGQWLLVTLTAGCGGSLLSIGSAAGVALMGQARGIYTFFSHLKWSWAIALGYVASILVHLWWNAGLF